MNFKLIYLLILVSSFFCHAQKNELARSNVRDEVVAIRDSLFSLKVDTVLIFYKGCYGCIKGTPSVAYAIWEKNGVQRIKKIDSFKSHETIDMTENVYTYYFSNVEDLMNQKLDDPQFELLHYRYSKITFWLNSKKYEKELSDFYRTIENENKVLVEWIRRIESVLFNIEVRYEYWLE